MGLRLFTVRRRAALTCVSGVGVVGGAERGLLSPGVRVTTFGGGELSAVGLPKNPPGVPRGGAGGLLNKLLGGAWGGALFCSPMRPPPEVGWGGVNAVSRPGDSPGLPNREGVIPSVDGALKRGVFAGSDVAFVGRIPRENGCIFDKSGFFLCDSVVFHWPKATLGDAGRGFGSGSVTAGRGRPRASWPEMGSLVSGELRVGLAEGLPIPIPYDEVEGAGKLGLSFVGVEGGVVLDSRDCCAGVASGEGSLAFVGLGVTPGEPEEDLESGCTEDSREAGKAIFVGSGTGLFFLGLCVVSPSSPDSRGNVVSSATGDSS